MHFGGTMGVQWGYPRASLRDVSEQQKAAQKILRERRYPRHAKAQAKRVGLADSVSPHEASLGLGIRPTGETRSQSIQVTETIPMLMQSGRALLQADKSYFLL